MRATPFFVAGVALIGLVTGGLALGLTYTVVCGGDGDGFETTKHTFVYAVCVADEVKDAPVVDFVQDVNGLRYTVDPLATGLYYRSGSPRRALEEMDAYVQRTGRARRGALVVGDRIEYGDDVSVHSTSYGVIELVWREEPLEPQD